MFSAVIVWFSLDGKEYPGTPETFQTFNDPKANIILDNGKNSTSIYIPLQSRMGKFIKVELKPKAKWLLLSEITFMAGNLLFHYYIQEIKRLNIFR